MRLFVGAYAAFPPGDETGGDQLIEALTRNEGVTGLELPFLGELKPHPAWRSDWRHVVTDIPGTAGHNATDPTFGLASTDGAGRAAALAFARDLHRDVRALAASGVQVEAVELHSAPSGRANPGALVASLREINDWEWGQTRLMIEHCDASTANHRGEKDFLPFAAELASVAEAARWAGGERWGLSLNWGRSAIEGRDAGVALSHIEQACAAGLLSALFFSSASGSRTEFGGPWVDRHLPPRGLPFSPEGSLLGGEQIRAALMAAGDVPIVGVKFGFRPDALPAEERAERLALSLALVARSAGLARSQ